MEEENLIKFNQKENGDYDDIYEKVDHKGIKFFLDKIICEDYLIPSFQREFVWNKDGVISLLTSLFRGYPIGSLLLCPINEHTKKFYKPKTFNYDLREASSGYVVLDGQQRLTSLFRAFSKVYSITKENDEDKFYRYFLKIQVKENKEGTIEKKDIEFSIEAKESQDIPFKEGDFYFFPLYLLFNNDKELEEWIDKFTKDYSKKNGKDENLIFKQATKLFNSTSTTGIFSRLFNKELIPYIILSSSASNNIKRVCDMFDKLNDKGMHLDDFDKISSRLFPNNIDLRNMWYEELKKYPLIKEFKIPPIDVVRIMSLIDQEEKNNEGFSVQLKYVKNYMDEFKDSKILDEKLDAACYALNESLNHLKNNQGLISKKWIPRNPVLIVFAASWYFIQKKERKITGNLISNLEKWYWCNIFDKTFDGSTITPIAEEFESLLDWFDDNKEIPKTIIKFRLAKDLNDIYKVNAQYKAVMCLLIKKGIIDFFDGKRIQDYPDKIDDHHIFPDYHLRTDLDIHEDKKINCITNRTLIHKSTNRSVDIGKLPPKKYLSEIKKLIGESKFKVLCETHLIEEDLDSEIYQNFVKFTGFREKKIMELIHKETKI